MITILFLAMATSAYAEGWILWMKHKPIKFYEINIDPPVFIMAEGDHGAFESKKECMGEAIYTVERVVSETQKRADKKGWKSNVKQHPGSRNSFYIERKDGEVHITYLCFPSDFDPRK